MCNRSELCGLAAHLIAVKGGDSARYFFSALDRAVTLSGHGYDETIVPWVKEYFPNNSDAGRLLPRTQRIPAQSVDDRVLAMCFLAAIAEEEGL